MNLIVNIISVINVLYLVFFMIAMKVILGKLSKSFSQSFYDLLKYNKHWMFLVFIGLAAILLLVKAYAKYEVDDKLPLLALSALAIFGVGVFAIFKRDKVSIMHYIMAGSGYGLAYVAFGWIGIIVGVVLSAISLLIEHKKLILIEFVLYIGLLVLINFNF